MPAYPVQKKRKLSNEATEPTKLHKKAAKAATKAAPPPKKAQDEPVDKDSEDASDEGQEKGEDVAEADDAEDIADEEAEVEKTFADLGLTDSLCDACATLGFKKPTPIQRESLPIALSGKDLIGLAETGSGKTAAFALPMLQALLDKPQPLFGLVIAPTRELAYQISQQFEALGSLINVKCAVLVGGMDMVPQAIALGKRPHIVVATPGRLLDHLENTKGFSLRQLKYLVMDEADRLLDLDFGPILDKIIRVLPFERHTMLFSATMNTKLDNLTRAALRNPVRVNISSSSYQTVKNLVQNYLFIPHKYKDIYLISLLHSFAGQTGIIFTRTVNEAARIAFLLRALGRSAIPLHGQMNQSARTSCRYRRCRTWSRYPFRRLGSQLRSASRLKNVCAQSGSYRACWQEWCRYLNRDSVRH
jgi:ATP-dependent RNA helicase DDX47/RRP3